MEENNEEEKTPYPLIIHAKETISVDEDYSIKIWLSYNFAKEWFQDAVNEATKINDHNAHRREILFSMCFAESYLVEWVRDEVLDRDHQKLSEYFIPGEGKGATNKWKDTLKNLHKDEHISELPDFSLSYWSNFVNLEKMRNGVVHASLSRPETDRQSESEKPYPSKNDLDDLPSGRAIQIVIELVKQLHYVTTTELPDCIIEQ